MRDQEQFLAEAIKLAHANLQKDGRPFGAVVVKNGEVIARGVNEILSSNDPTSHAELNALRTASQKLGSPDLSGCAVYASGQPCPMCMAAMRMSGISEVYFAYSNADAEPYGLATTAIYADLAKPFSEQSMKIQHLPPEPGTAPALYSEWKKQQS